MKCFFGYEKNWEKKLRAKKEKRGLHAFKKTKEKKTPCYFLKENLKLELSFIIRIDLFYCNLVANWMVRLFAYYKIRKKIKKISVSFCLSFDLRSLNKSKPWVQNFANYILLSLNFKLKKKLSRRVFSLCV